MTTRFMHSVVLAFMMLISPAFGQITVQFSSEPTQYDPLFMEDGAALRIAANVIATPFEYDGAGNLKKNLVSQISLSKDKKKYTIKFKKNLKWSDGVKFHASQFVAAVRRLATEPVKVALSELIPAFDLSNTKVLDSLTAEVTLKAPEAQFANWLSLPPFSPIRDDMKDAFEKRNPIVPTLAAYQVVDYKREDYLLLKKNPEYVNKDAISIDQVKIRFLKDESSLLSIMKAGDVDILSRVPVLQLEQIKKIAHVSEVPVEAVTYLGLNTKKPPFNDVANRRALLDALFFKRAELSNLLKTGELMAGTFLPPILIPNSYSIKIANEKKSQKPRSKLEFQAQSDAGSRNQTILEYVQSILKDEYGWKMKINMLDWKAHYSKLKSDSDEVFRFGWQNPVSDPYVMYQVLASGSANNFTGWKNAEFDSLLNELKQEVAQVKRAKLIERIEQILLLEAPVVPLLHQVLRFANSKRVQGFRANSFGVILFRELRLAKN